MKNLYIDSFLFFEVYMRFEKMLTNINFTFYNLYYSEPQLYLFILIHKYPALRDRMQISRQIENTASVCLHCIVYQIGFSVDME
jgi:hypothetical protein